MVKRMDNMRQKVIKNVGESTTTHPPSVQTWIAQADEIMRSAGCRVTHKPHKPNDTMDNSCIVFVQNRQLSIKLIPTQFQPWFASFLVNMFYSVLSVLDTRLCH